MNYIGCSWLIDIVLRRFDMVSLWAFARIMSMINEFLMMFVRDLVAVLMGLQMYY